jgi:hypothetical protein
LALLMLAWTSDDALLKRVKGAERRRDRGRARLNAGVCRVVMRKRPDIGQG